MTYFGLVFIYFGGQGHSGGSDDDRGPAAAAAAAAANRRRSNPTTLTMLATTTLPTSINGSRTPDTDESELPWERKFWSQMAAEQLAR